MMSRNSEKLSCSNNMKASNTNNNNNNNNSNNNNKSYSASINVHSILNEQQQLNNNQQEQQQRHQQILTKKNEAINLDDEEKIIKQFERKDDNEWSYYSCNNNIEDEIIINNNENNKLNNLSQSLVNFNDKKIIENHYENLTNKNSISIDENFIRNNYNNHNNYNSISDENIYENICDNCGNIFNQKNCENCELKNRNNKKNNNNKSHKFLGGLFLNLKQKNNQQQHLKGAVPKKILTKKKLDIVHNIDGYDNVFKTNKTFDLNEICLMRSVSSASSTVSVPNTNNYNYNSQQQEQEQQQQQQQTNSSKKRHSSFFGRFRKSAENLKYIDDLDTNNYNRRRQRHTKSELDILQHKQLQQQQQQLNSSNITTSSYKKLTTNSTPDLVLNNNNNLMRDDKKFSYLKYNKSTKISDVTYEWILSIKKQTIDYNENTILNIKSIPCKKIEFSDLIEIQQKTYKNKDRKNVGELLDGIEQDKGKDENVNDDDDDDDDKFNYCESEEYYKKIVENFQMNCIVKRVKLRRDNNNIIINRLERKKQIKPIIFDWQFNQNNSNNNNNNNEDEPDELNEHKNINESEFVSGLMQIFDTYLYEKKLLLMKDEKRDPNTGTGIVGINKEDDKNNDNNVCENTTELSLITTNINNNLIIEKNRINNDEKLLLLKGEHALSVSSNRIILTYDKNFKLILNINKIQPDYFCKYQKIIVENFLYLIKYLEKVNDNNYCLKNNKSCKLQRQNQLRHNRSPVTSLCKKKSKLCDFIKKNKVNSNEKCLNDFIKKSPVESIKKDFQLKILNVDNSCEIPEHIIHTKQPEQEIQQQPKKKQQLRIVTSIIDFEKKIPVTDVVNVKTNISDFIKINKMNEENMNSDDEKQLKINSSTNDSLVLRRVNDLNKPGGLNSNNRLAKRAGVCLNIKTQEHLYAVSQRSSVKYFDHHGNIVDEGDEDDHENNHNDEGEDDDDDDTDDEEEEENIYQPIWNFQTIGEARESYNSEIYENLYDSNEYCDEVDDGEWEVAEEFSFSTNVNDDKIIEEDENQDDTIEKITTNDDIKNNNIILPKIEKKILKKSVFFRSPFRRICIFYNLENPKLNRINYDYEQYQREINQIRLTKNELKLPIIYDTVPNDNHSNNNNDDDNYNDGENIYENIDLLLQSRKYVPIPPNVLEWKFSLLKYSVMEDEEDLIMTENIIQEPVHTKGVSFTSITTSGFGVLNIKNNPSSEKILGNDSSSIFGRYKSKFDENEVDVKPSTGGGSDDNDSIKSKESIIADKKKYKAQIKEEKEKKKKREKEKVLVFGDLDKVELDAEYQVPKFIVECIKIIELTENITTNGIYRASGNKINIELVKTKMTGKREPKYSYLKDQDVHTLTGVLKLFFRETTNLIPEEVFENIPKNLGVDENLEILKNELNKLPTIQKATLKYLMNHLKNVRDNSTANLMNSMNLSIIWGACLFTNSVNSALSLMGSDIMYRNVLVKILIDNYDKIFNNNSTSITIESSNL